MTTELIHDDVRAAVRGVYEKAAVGVAPPGCCGSAPCASLQLGYTPEDLAVVPEGANLGLGCGNPRAIAALRPGETVLDLGSGAQIPVELRDSIAAFTGCMAGAAGLGELKGRLEDAGFDDVRIAPHPEMNGCIGEWLPGTGAEKYVASATIEARKPNGFAG